MAKIPLKGDLFPGFEPKDQQPKYKLRGHAARPGTGPDGETCGTCEHIVRIKYAKVYRKCILIEAKWTHGYGTDIRVKDPACSRWEKSAPEDPERGGTG